MLIKLINLDVEYISQELTLPEGNAENGGTTKENIIAI